MRSIVQQPRTVQLWIENDKKRAAHEKGKGPKRQFYVQQTENQKQAGHWSSLISSLHIHMTHKTHMTCFFNCFFLYFKTQETWCSLRGLNPRLADANKSAELQALVEAEAQRQADAFRTCQEDGDGPKTKCGPKHKTYLVNAFFAKQKNSLEATKKQLDSSMHRGYTELVYTASIEVPKPVNFCLLQAARMIYNVTTNSWEWSQAEWVKSVDSHSFLLPVMEQQTFHATKAPAFCEWNIAHSCHSWVSPWGTCRGSVVWSNKHPDSRCGWSRTS